eukprot:CAMPEP_0174755006 /NCGR_PEP_ID=MMETSP1094-20130205/106027_1 /TAXON_ID=156173 /ORGANISM="Chrysochromulina brevifilum, Strain UTEX LB 985" /LENGTH=129 /DNA_ID=CAMNT_0015960889 /DNA_START=511 /DNA_END=901 /DNA_ORIENTATION=-
MRQAKSAGEYGIEVAHVCRHLMSTRGGDRTDGDDRCEEQADCAMANAISHTVAPSASAPSPPLPPPPPPGRCVPRGPPLPPPPPPGRCVPRRDEGRDEGGGRGGELRMWDRWQMVLEAGGGRGGVRRTL